MRDLKKGMGSVCTLGDTPTAQLPDNHEVALIIMDSIETMMAISKGSQFEYLSYLLKKSYMEASKIADTNRPISLTNVLPDDIQWKDDE